MSADDAILSRLPETSLASLAVAVEAGWLSGESPEAALAPMAGDESPAVARWLRGLENDRFTALQIARVLRAVIAGRQRDRTLMPDLVISGPEVAGVPTADTRSVVQNLFLEATQEVLIAGYAFWNARELFERLAQRLRSNPQLKVIFHVDIARRDAGTSEDATVLRYAAEFRERHWPWDPFPEVWYDPRALSLQPGERASLHAKAVIVDRQVLFLTSANFTEAAQNRNIEMGLLTRTPYLAESACAYWAALRTSGRLRRLP